MRVALVLIAFLAMAPSGPGPAARAPKDRLAFTVWPQGLGAGKPVSHWRLRCRPPGGSYPRPAAFNRTDGCEIERWDRVAFLFAAR